MKKISLLIFLALAGFNAFAQSKKTYQIEEENVIETLKYLTSDELEGRDSGSKGIELAANYLEKQFLDSGIKTYFKSYKDTLTDFQPAAYNVVGIIEGNDPVLKNEYVILGAHYDHIGRIVPEQPWGVSTQKGKTLYLHVLKLEGEQLQFDLSEKVKSVVSFVGKQKLNFKQDKKTGNVLITLPAERKGLDYIVEVTLK